MKQGYLDSIHSIPIRGHGSILCTQISEEIIDLLESSINNVIDGNLKTAVVEFGKVAYIYKTIDDAGLILDENGRDARKEAESICGLLRVKTRSEIEHNVWFWQYAILQYRVLAEQWGG